MTIKGKIYEMHNIRGAQLIKIFSSYVPKLFSRIVPFLSIVDVLIHFVMQDRKSEGHK